MSLNQIAPLSIAVFSAAKEESRRLVYGLKSVLPDVVVGEWDPRDVTRAETSAKSHLAVGVGCDRNLVNMAPLLDSLVQSDAEITRFLARAQSFDQRRRERQLPADLPPILVSWTPYWAETASRLGARIRNQFPHGLATIDHIGSTAVAGLPAKNIIDLQVSVERLEDCDHVDGRLHSAGFVNVQNLAPWAPGVMRDNPRGQLSDHNLWDKRLYASVDEENRVIIHVRRINSPGWRYALLFRDWLSKNATARDEYAAVKISLASAHAKDAHFDDYARAKDYWFANAYDQSEQWASATQWTPRTYEVKTL